MGNLRSLFDTRITSENLGMVSTAKEQPIMFYIEVYEESSAYYLAARLQKEHWEINVMPAGSCWILLAHALVTPDHQTIGDLCDYLSDLSEFYGGSFKRWELNSLS